MHPQWHFVFGFPIAIAPIYISSQIELGAKVYRLKHSIANLMNQPNYTLNATTVLAHTSQGRALLFLVSKQNLKPSSLRM
jgi:hypothetical protein